MVGEREAVERGGGSGGVFGLRRQQAVARPGRVAPRAPGFPGFHDFRSLDAIAAVVPSLPHDPGRAFLAPPPPPPRLSPRPSR